MSVPPVATRIIGAITSIAITACTTWSAQTVYGPKRELERHLLGSPAIEESSASSLSGGFQHDSASFHNRHWHDSSSIGSFGGDTSSTKLTHCVQQAEIHYSQPFEVTPVVANRPLDVLGALTLVAFGGIILLAANQHAQTIFHPGDPLYTEPPSAAPGFIVGGALMAGGAGLLAYSFGSLPKSPAPPVRQGTRDLVETELVEATGCGLPGDPAARR